MADRIDLSTAERHAAEMALLLFVDSPQTGVALDAVLAAINKVRDGDPVGTIKRDPVTGYLAQREEIDGHRYWVPLILPSKRPDGEPETVDADEWTTIHTPPSAESYHYVIHTVEDDSPPSAEPPCGVMLGCGTTATCWGCLPQREPRVFDRGLGDTERDAQWIDRQGDIWRWYVPGAGMAVWQYRAPTGSQWIDIFRYPDSQYAPFTEVLQP